MTNLTPDNDAGFAHARADEPDAHGQAAFLLAESTLHMLIAKHTLTNADALEVVQVASEVKVDVAMATGESNARMEESLALLAGLTRSLTANAL